MKTRINNVKKGVVTLLFAAVIAGLTACETDPVKSQRGELPNIVFITIEQPKLIRNIRV